VFSVLVSSPARITVLEQFNSLLLELTKEKIKIFLPVLGLEVEIGCFEVQSRLFSHLGLGLGLGLGKA